MTDYQKAIYLLSNSVNRLNEWFSLDPSAANWQMIQRELAIQRRLVFQLTWYATWRRETLTGLRCALRTWWSRVAP